MHPGDPWNEQACLMTEKSIRYLKDIPTTGEDVNI